MKPFMDTLTDIFFTGLWLVPVQQTGPNIYTFWLLGFFFQREKKKWNDEGNWNVLGTQAEYNKIKQLKSH